MSDFCRVTLTADPMSRTGADELLAWLGYTPPGSSRQAVADANAISFQTTSGGLEFCGSTRAVEALLAQLRPSLDQLGIVVAEKQWARDRGFVNIMGRVSYRTGGSADPGLIPQPDAGKRITLH